MNATAYADQYAAAARDAIERLNRAGVSQPMHVLVDPWLTSQAAMFDTDARAGMLRTCPHITASPTVAHAAVWAPQRLVCDLCILTLGVAGTVEDSTCDRCREAGRLLNRGTISLGPVLLHFGLCTPCVNASSVYRSALAASSGTGSANRAGSADATRRATSRSRPTSRKPRR